MLDDEDKWSKALGEAYKYFQPEAQIPIGAEIADEDIPL
jgi:hypothetical protein